MNVDTCEGAVWVPDPNPMVLIARSAQARFLARLCDDVLWDVLVAYDREQRARPTKLGALMLDAVRADFSRRHAPLEQEPVCNHCLCAFDAHDEDTQTCPDDERFLAAA